MLSRILFRGILLLAVCGYTLSATAVLAFNQSDKTELMARCRGKDDRQAVITACSQIIDATRDKLLLEKAHNRRGLAYESLGQHALAVEDFDVVIRLNPKIAGYFDNRQRALVGLGRYEDALRDANTAVRMAPTYPFVFHGRGVIYADLNRFDLAIQDFNTALGLNPQDAPLRVDRGKVFRKVGLIDNALADFNSAHAIDPNFMGALRERGLTYLAAGRSDAARDDLTQVLAAQPPGQQDADVVAALQQLSLSDTGGTQPTAPALAFSQEASPNRLAVPAAPSADDIRRAAEQTQAEQRRKGEEEAAAARQAAAIKLREERLARATTSAKKLIDEASAFIKADPGNAKVLDYVQQVAELNSSLSSGNPDAIEGQTVALGGALQGDGDFTSFRQHRAEAQHRQNARDLADAVRMLATQKTFMVKVVTRDPTAASAHKLLQRIKDTDAALAAPALDPVQVAMGRNDAALQEADLATEFMADQKLAEQAAANAPAATAGAVDQAQATPADSKPSFAIVATDKNAFLLKGDLQDVVFLYNTSPRAPHVIRNLRGDIVFGDDRANVCAFGHGPDDDLAPLVKSTLSAYPTAKTIVVADGTCEPDRLATYDVIVTRRGTFLRQASQAALDLIKAVETDQFATLVTVTSAQVQAASAADAVTATAIAADVDAGTRAGYGVLLFTSGSPAVCLVAASQVEAHRQVLLALGNKLAADMGTSPRLAPTTAEGAFANSKHGQCGAIYAVATDLKDLVAGLKRDGVAYRFSSLWVTPDKVKGADDALQADKAAATKQAADRQRQQAEAERLSSLRAADEAAKLDARQAASREQYGPAAKASAARVAQDVKEFTAQPQAGEQEKVAARLFPVFATRFRDALANRWELMSVNDELADYGTSDFKGRPLDTLITRITLNLKNRMLGDYRTECVLFGEVEDAEFAMRRDPVSVDCDDVEALAAWKTQHAFQSRWNLK